VGQDEDDIITIDMLGTETLDQSGPRDATNWSSDLSLIPFFASHIGDAPGRLLAWHAIAVWQAPCISVKGLRGSVIPCESRVASLRLSLAGRAEPGGFAEVSEGVDARCGADPVQGGGLDCLRGMGRYTVSIKPETHAMRHIVL
jgi:hypothetical protein